MRENGGGAKIEPGKDIAAKLHRLERRFETARQKAVKAAQLIERLSRERRRVGENPNAVAVAPVRVVNRTQGEQVAEGRPIVAVIRQLDLNRPCLAQRVNQLLDSILLRLLAL